MDWFYKINAEIDWLIQPHSIIMPISRKSDEQIKICYPWLAYMLQVRTKSQGNGIKDWKSLPSCTGNSDYSTNSPSRFLEVTTMKFWIFRGWRLGAKVGSPLLVESGVYIGRYWGLFRSSLGFLSHHQAAVSTGASQGKKRFGGEMLKIQIKGMIVHAWTMHVCAWTMLVWSWGIKRYQKAVLENKGHNSTCMEDARTCMNHTRTIMGYQKVSKSYIVPAWVLRARLW